MRLKKGSKVEVFCPNEKPAGSWRGAEIIFGNGHNYTVKYDVGQFSELIEERVPRKLFRPSPPPVVLSGNWKPGDVVEVLHNFSWKMATVSKVFVRDRFLVRLVGSSNEFEVRNFNIRVRQSWLDNKWVIIGKSYLNYDDRESNQLLTMKHNPVSWSQLNRLNSKIELQLNHDHNEKTINFQSSHNVSARSRKRDPPYGSHAVACKQKYRLIERKGKYHPAIGENVCQLPEKVVNNAFGGEILGNNEIHSFAKNRKGSVSSVDEERIKTDGDATCSSSSSSIGSNDPFNCHEHLHPGEYVEDHSSDAESFCWNEEERNSFLSTKEEMAAEIHRLELHAYRCTMEALHASGPLSWEQETLMTNLRISLHISNDEHLMELRNLISNSSSTPIN